MSLSSKPCARAVLGAAGAFVALALFASPGQAQRAEAYGPFAGLSGVWSGGGVVALANGTNERIRCRATYYTPEEGRDLRLNLRCASDSYNFDLRSDVRAQGGEISGVWSETTRNAGGSVSGRAGGGQVQAMVDGPGFSAGLAMSTRGNRQSVTIRSQGTDVRQVSITLSRR